LLVFLSQLASAVDAVDIFVTLRRNVEALSGTPTP
jgi:hypothetical protein